MKSPTRLDVVLFVAIGVVLLAGIAAYVVGVANGMPPFLPVP
jgi:hypothetical protein